MIRKALIASVPATLLLAAANPAHALLQSDIITDVKQLQPTGSDFNASLAREYRGFAIFENDEMWDFLDAEHFALKAQRAAAGQSVPPERVEDWEIKEPAARQELMQGRARLVKALDDGAAARAPQEAAIAQARFDCWIEQKEENYQPAHIAACRDEFAKAISALESAMQKQPPMAQAPATREALVFFDFDRSNITPEAADILRSFASNAAPGPQKMLVIEGHADRSGPVAYNEALSMRRAQAVQAQLGQLGVSFDRYRDVQVVAKGETDPLVPTDDGVREPQNRRVVVRAVEQAAQTSQTPR